MKLFNELQSYEGSIEKHLIEDIKCAETKSCCKEDVNVPMTVSKTDENMSFTSPPLDSEGRKDSAASLLITPTVDASEGTRNKTCEGQLTRNKKKSEEEIAECLQKGNLFFWAAGALQIEDHSLFILMWFQKSW